MYYQSNIRFRKQFWFNLQSFCGRYSLFLGQNIKGIPMVSRKGREEILPEIENSKHPRDLENTCRITCGCGFAYK